MREKLTLKLLRSTAYFQKFTRGPLLKIHKAMKTVTVFKDQVLTFESVENNYFFLIVSGEFELSKKVKKPISDQKPNENVIVKEVDLLKKKIRGEN